MRTMLWVLGTCLLSGVARAEVKLEPLEYKSGETICEGVLAHDPEVKDKRPGILIVHDWLGISDETRRRAKMLAELGYVAFCVDVYGKGVRPAPGKEASAEAGKYKQDRTLMLQRLAAAFETFAKHEKVDPKRIAAIGYCFGGTCVLEMARAGLDLAGVVSFHGGLKTSAPAEEGKVKAKVLVLHGADDPHVPPEEVTAFEKEMRAAKADWQLVAYGNAVHSFTNPKAGNDNSKGAAYEARADKRSWEALKVFLGELFAAQ